MGDNLHDHMFVPLTYVMKSARNRGTTPYFVGGIISETVRGDTWMGRSVFEVVGFVGSSRADQVPDIQIHALPWSYPFPNQDAPTRHKVDKRSALTIFSTLIYPKSRGTLRLASAEPAAAPVIDPGYLTEPDDTEVLLDGMELIREAMNSKIIAADVDLELSPGRDYRDRAALAREVPNRATSVYHAVGTCRMGMDERAVVDPALRVAGVDGLRVADAAGILSGSLYHHFDSKESIGEEILSSFINDVLADYRAAASSAAPPRDVIEQIVRSTSRTLSRHRAALAMLQNDWNYFSTHDRFGYLRPALGEIERTWITQFERGREAGAFRADLDPRLTCRLLRDVLWIPAQWGAASGGYSGDQVADAILRLLFDGILSRTA